MQGQADEVPRFVLEHCSGWKELYNVSVPVQVALRSRGTSTQMLIRTRLCSGHTFWFATESVIMHAASLKVHRCHDIGKRVYENYV